MKKNSRTLQIAAAVTALAALGGAGTGHAADLSSLSSSTLLPGPGVPGTSPTPDPGTAAEELLVNTA